MDGKHIVIYDGVCNLCNFSVRFLLKIDHNNSLQFAHLQSRFSKELIGKTNIPSADYDSVAFLSNTKVYYKSGALIEISRVLGFPWNIMYIFKFLSSNLLDKFYDFVASNRYKWFGKKTKCELPTSYLKTRFIDN